MRCEDIGVKVSRTEFVDFLNGVQPGQFFHIKGYKSQNSAKKVSDDPDDPDGLSEIADYWARIGIKYSNFKTRDVALLQSILAGEKQDTINVTHGAWVPEGVPLFLEPQAISALSDRDRSELVYATITRQVPLVGAGFPETSRPMKTSGAVNLLDITVFSNKESKGREQVTLNYYLQTSHPLVVAAIGAEDLKGTLMQSLLRPAAATTDYKKQAQSLASLDRADGEEMWYIRDVAVVRKVVRRLGTHRFKASLPLVAVKNTIEAQLLLRGKYRTFILNAGNFININIAGQAILVDGMDEAIYFALPEDVKAAAAVEAEVVGS